MELRYGGGANYNMGIVIDMDAESTAPCSSYNVGVDASVNRGGADNIGNYIEVSRGVNNIGIWSRIGPFGPPSPVCTGGYNYAGVFEGDVIGTGTFTGNTSLPSDIKFKKNIETINNADSLLNLINAVSFVYKRNEFPDMHFDSLSHYGFIAQEVEAIMPELVKTSQLPALRDRDNNITRAALEFKTVSYEAFIPLLVKGYQQQKELIDSLTTGNDSALAELQERLDSTTNANAATIAAMQNNINTLLDRMAAVENC
ncbi:MAG: hypothetical protein K0S44_893 [Bacteroidetes bacterium]|jgi:hypothetical protein|nr:hypothetical protein [Bacteroidota bacterium]